MIRSMETLKGEESLVNRSKMSQSWLKGRKDKPSEAAQDP